MATRDDILKEARSWINVPFKHQGRTRNGVDCVGLVVVVCRALGVSSYDSTVYSRRPSEDISQFLGHFRENCIELPKWTDAKPADLLVFSHRGLPCHVGFRSSIQRSPAVIHSVAAYRCVRETPLTNEWLDSVKFAFQLPNLTEA